MADQKRQVGSCEFILLYVFNLFKEMLLCHTDIHLREYKAEKDDLI